MSLSFSSHLIVLMGDFKLNLIFNALDRLSYGDRQGISLLSNHVDTAARACLMRRRGGDIFSHSNYLHVALSIMISYMRLRDSYSKRDT